MGWRQRCGKGRKLEVRTRNRTHWSLYKHCTDFNHNSWSDCTEWKYTKWDVKKEQPDSGMGNEDCVQFVSVKGQRDGWHDVDCRFKKKYVCSRKLCGTGKGQEPASTRFLTRTLRVPSIFVRARNSATKILSSLVSYFLSPMIAGFCQNIRQI